MDFCPFLFFFATYTCRKNAAKRHFVRYCGVFAARKSAKNGNFAPSSGWGVATSPHRCSYVAFYGIRSSRRERPTMKASSAHVLEGRADLLSEHGAEARAQGIVSFFLLNFLPTSPIGIKNCYTKSECFIPYSE